MIVALLILILIAILFPGALRFLFWAIVILVVVAALHGHAQDYCDNGCVIQCPNGEYVWFDPRSSQGNECEEE
jgi:hypothetical protein